MDFLPPFPTGYLLPLISVLLEGIVTQATSMNSYQKWQPQNMSPLQQL